MNVFKYIALKKEPPLYKARAFIKAHASIADALEAMANNDVLINYGYQEYVVREMVFILGRR